MKLTDKQARAIEAFCIDIYDLRNMTIWQTTVRMWGKEYRETERITVEGKVFLRPTIPLSKSDGVVSEYHTQEETQGIKFNIVMKYTE